MRSPLWRSVCAFLFCALLLNPSYAFAANYRPEPAGLADGAGIWANIWHYPTGDLDSYCTNLRNNGIRNLFIQTSRSNTEAIKHPKELSDLLDACHRHRIRVIAWSFAELKNPVADADKMIAAARFTSASGQQLDAIAPNLEQNLEQWRVEAYSKRLREVLGRSYPMIAVVYSPLNKAPEVARIPWKTLGKYYDIIAPMAYWNSKYQKLDAYEYTVATCGLVRELTGRPDIEIHVIGDGMGTKSDSIHAFMRGCKMSEATSASLYPNHLVTPEQYSTMSRYSDYFQPNSRFRLAAFRELLSSGSVAAPRSGSPAEPIPRGEFYKLLVKHLRLAKSPDLSHHDAAGILYHAGLVATPHMPDQVLSSAMYGDEALSLLAQIVEFQQVSPKHSRKRADRWFAQPAMAENVPRPASLKPINFLDACQMVLEAGSAIR